jgi:hypothetical protein
MASLVYSTEGTGGGTSFFSTVTVHWQSIAVTITVTGQHSCTTKKSAEQAVARLMLSDMQFITVVKKYTRRILKWDEFEEDFSS